MKRKMPDVGEEVETRQKGGEEKKPEPEEEVAREAMLVTCPECGAKVSEYADHCPKCGYPSPGRMEAKKREQGRKEKPKEPAWLTIWYTIVGLVTISLLLYGLWMFIRS